MVMIPACHRSGFGGEGSERAGSAHGLSGVGEADSTADVWADDPYA